LDAYSPYPAILKAMMAQQHGYPLWPVRPPLVPVQKAVSQQAAREFFNAAKNI